MRRKLLEAALGYYQDFIERQADDPSVQAELIDSRWRVASLLEEMGAKEDALAMFEQVRAAMGPPPGGKWWTGGQAFGVASLLTQEAVQKELKLSEEQTHKIAVLADRRKELAWGRRGPADDARRAADLEANEEACFGVLRPEQARRLRQIVWQQRGAHVFTDLDVADTLQLTPDQRDRVRAIEDGAWKEIKASFPRAPGDRSRREPPGEDPSGDKRPEAPRNDDFSKGVEFWKGVRERLAAVLTDEQKSKWKEMTGEPFQGDIHFGAPTPGFFPWPHSPH